MVLVAYQADVVEQFSAFIRLECGPETWKVLYAPQEVGVRLFHAEAASTTAFCSAASVPGSHSLIELRTLVNFCCAFAGASIVHVFASCQQ